MKRRHVLMARKTKKRLVKILARQHKMSRKEATGFADIMGRFISKSPYVWRGMVKAFLQR